MNAAKAQEIANSLADYRTRRLAEVEREHVEGITNALLAAYEVGWSDGCKNVRPEGDPS